MSQPDFRAKVVLEARVSPSEDPSKVAGALGKVVGEEPGGVVAGSDSARLVTENVRAMTRIRDQLRDRHVRSAARRQLLLNRSGRSTSVMLNRQAAAAGVLAICGSSEESPLGPIYLTIESDRLDRAIDWLTAYAEG
jgi:predicted RNA binding protein with dsRBD fold (UPF0201 family)